MLNHPKKVKNATGAIRSFPIIFNKLLGIVVFFSRFWGLLVHCSAL
jgi:hypothetical protein